MAQKAESLSELILFLLQTVRLIYSCTANITESVHVTLENT